MHYEDKLGEQVNDLILSKMASRDADIAHLICDYLVNKEIVKRFGVGFQIGKDYLKSRYTNTQCPRPHIISISPV